MKKNIKAIQSKSVNNDHLQDTEFVTVVDRWSLFGGYENGSPK